MLSTLFSGFCVFFFKQKTAYEMRISDWSSDVCSSDLYSAQKLNLVVAGQLGPLQAKAVTLRGNLAYSAYSQMFSASGIELVVQEIGRASCRERVCKYV